MVTPTPLQLSDRLSRITGADVYLKREDLQIVRSYKLRGAYNLLVQLSGEEMAAGVVCSSAGNHAQGFAYACRTLGVHGRVYVPASRHNPRLGAALDPVLRKGLARAADERQASVEEFRDAFVTAAGVAQGAGGY